MKTGEMNTPRFNGRRAAASSFTWMNFIRCSIPATTKECEVAKPIIRFNRSLWLHCMKELQARSHGRHESGCFILGTVDRHKRHAQHCVLYDELDPHAYASGVCILQGDSFTRLWEICRAEKLTVIADIHTHPAAAFQSEADRTNPMIARAGHLAIIVPDFAFGWIWRHRLGLFHYEGDHRWTNLSGWQSRSVLKIRWSFT